MFFFRPTMLWNTKLIFHWEILLLRDMNFWTSTAIVCLQRESYRLNNKKKNHCTHPKHIDTAGFLHKTTLRKKAICFYADIKCQNQGQTVSSLYNLWGKQDPSVPSSSYIRYLSQHSKQNFKGCALMNESISHRNLGRSRSVAQGTGPAEQQWFTNWVK